jgi:signal transduction histidine kinase
MLSTDHLERQLLDALPMTIYTTDLEGRLTSIHHPAARFGDEAQDPSASPGDEIRERPIWEVVGDGLPRAQVEHAMRHLRAGRAPVVRWEMTRGDSPDRPRVLLAQMTPLQNDAHAVTGFVISTTDITASHRVREAAVDAGVALSRTISLDRVYNEASQQLRQMLRPDLVVIALLDEDGATLRIAYLSGDAGDHRAAHQRFRRSWEAAIESGEPVTAHDDSTLELTVPLTSETGVFGVMTVVADDIESPERLADTHRFVASVATQTSAAIERARLVAHVGDQRRIQTIGEVTAGVAQELRNPIFGISSAAQLLRFRAREDPVMEKNVGRILREVERLNRMVTTLLELGRPITLKLAPGDPDAVWDDVLETERGRLESRAVALRRTRVEPSKSIPIDVELLAKAFGRILSNAVEAAPEASDITLSSAELPNGAWRCRLTNGGPPIAPDVLPRVFELFVSTKPGSTGTGLGLAHRIIDEHRGTISIESSAAAGTTAVVTLPRT